MPQRWLFQVSAGRKLIGKNPASDFVRGDTRCEHVRHFFMHLTFPNAACRIGSESTLIVGIIPFRYGAILDHWVTRVRPHLHFLQREC